MNAIRIIWGAFVIFYTVAYVITLHLQKFLGYLMPVLIPVGIVAAVIFFGVSKVQH